jgi:hypothetical protein
MLWSDVCGKLIAYQPHQHREKTEPPNFPLTQGGRFKTILHVCTETVAQALRIIYCTDISVSKVALANFR